MRLEDFSESAETDGELRKNDESRVPVTGRKADVAHNHPDRDVSTMRWIQTCRQRPCPSPHRLPPGVRSTGTALVHRRQGTECQHTRDGGPGTAPREFRHFDHRSRARRGASVSCRTSLLRMAVACCCAVRSCLRVVAQTIWGLHTSKRYFGGCYPVQHGDEAPS